MKSSDDIALHSSAGTWFGSLLNVAILLLTVELLNLSRQNLANTQRNAENSTQTVELLEKINKRLEGKI